MPKEILPDVRGRIIESIVKMGYVGKLIVLLFIVGRGKCFGWQ